MYEEIPEENEVAEGSEAEEMEALKSQLEIGIVVTVFLKRNRQPEKKTLLLKKETSQIVWYNKISRRNLYEWTSKSINSP